MDILKIVESRLIVLSKPDDTQSLLSTYFNNFINRQIIQNKHLSKRVFVILFDAVTLIHIS